MCEVFFSLLLCIASSVVRELYVHIYERACVCVCVWGAYVCRGSDKQSVFDRKQGDCSVTNVANTVLPLSSMGTFLVTPSIASMLFLLSQLGSHA